MQEIRVWSLGQEDPLEKGMATHSSILAWRIPWTEEPGRLQFMGSQRMGQNWANNTLQKEKKIWKVHENRGKMKITEPHLKAIMDMLVYFLSVFFFSSIGTCAYMEYDKMIVLFWSFLLVVRGSARSHLSKQAIGSWLLRRGTDVACLFHYNWNIKPSHSCKHSSQIKLVNYAIFWGESQP